MGPDYTVTSLTRALGWTEAKVTEAGETLRLLSLETDDGVRSAPHFSSKMGSWWRD